MTGYVLCAELARICSLRSKNKIRFMNRQNKCTSFGLLLNRKEVHFWKLSLSINWEEFTIEEEVKDRKRLTVRSVNNMGEREILFMTEEQRKLFEDTFLSSVLDRMDTHIYITDLETDEILYMNENMKHAFWA